MKLYIGNLNFRTRELSLKKLFSTCGEVRKTKVIIDYVTKKSKCFGFVEMVTEEGGNLAIAQLNGTELDQNTITVKKVLKKYIEQSNRW